MQNNIQTITNSQQTNLFEQNIPFYYETVEYYPQENLSGNNYLQQFQLTNFIQKNYLQPQFINPQNQQNIQQQYYFSSQYVDNQSYFHQQNGLTENINQTSQMIKIEEVSSNNLQGGFDQMTQSKGYEYNPACPEEITYRTNDINNIDSNTLNSCDSFNQSSQSVSPTTISSPKNNRSCSFKINSLSYIQDQSNDIQNQSTLDQSFNYLYNSQKSSLSQSSFIDSKLTLSHEQNENTSTCSYSDNRKIIQTYQKISKININKNIIKAFKKFMTDKENSDIISSFGFINESKNQCKQMKIFFDSLNHNNHSVTKIIDHPIYAGPFEFFLTFYAEQWLQLSRVQDKESHFIAIDFFKLCCSENKVKHSNFKYYSKRKNSNKNTSANEKSSSQIDSQ